LAVTDGLYPLFYAVFITKGCLTSRFQWSTSFRCEHFQLCFYELWGI